MKKSLATLTLVLCTFAAQATGTYQQVTSNLVNQGGIKNSISTHASTYGVGSSYSAATSEGKSVANATSTTEINPVCGGACGAKSGSVKVTGEMTTLIKGTAFNTSSGAGVGNATSTGMVYSGVNANASYTGPGQQVSVMGKGEQGASYSVQAAENTGGYAVAGNEAKFTAEGAVGSKTCYGTNACGGSVINKEVWGSVSDSKTSNSFVNTGAMTVDGTLLNQAPVNATATSNVHVEGNFYDPL